MLYAFYALITVFVIYASVMSLSAPDYDDQVDEWGDCMYSETERIGSRSEALLECAHLDPDAG